MAVISSSAQETSIGARRTVTAVDPGSGKRIGGPFQVTGNLDAMVAGEGRMWILDKGAGTVIPVDPASGPGNPQPVGEDPTDLAVGLGAAWVSDQDGTITRIDAGTCSQRGSR